MSGCEILASLAALVIVCETAHAIVAAICDRPRSL